MSVGWLAPWVRTPLTSAVLKLTTSSMSLSQRRCRHRSLHKGKKSKLLAVVLFGCKSNEELSWISHVKITNHCMGCKKKTKKRK